MIFFRYAVNEALHISHKERASITDMFLKLRYELEQSVDKHSREILAAHLELLLKYCQRFYERQFQTRAQENLELSSRLTEILDQYMCDKSLLKLGPPNVGYCAKKLSLSPNYFGGLTRQLLGVSAQEFIQTYLIEVAKEKLGDKSLNINEIAFALGFEYPNHFSRFFKNQTGISPSEYKLSLN